MKKRSWNANEVVYLTLAKALLKYWRIEFVPSAVASQNTWLTDYILTFCRIKLSNEEL